MVFLIKPARRGVFRRNQWVIVLVANNGEPLMHSETYSNRNDAISSADLIRLSAADATIDAH